MLVMRVEVAPDTGGPGRHRGGAGMLTDIHWRHAGFHNHFTTQVGTPPRGAFGGGYGQIGGEWLFDGEAVGNAPGWLGDRLHGDHAKAQPMAGLIDPVTNAISLDARPVFHDRDVPASAGSVARSLSNGAGGWGHPADRPAERVLRDVRDGYVSLRGAAEIYGVVIAGEPDTDPEGLAIDEAATAELRARMAAGIMAPACAIP
jgi:N-methylhydantoinase B